MSCPQRGLGRGLRLDQSSIREIPAKPGQTTPHVEKATLYTRPVQHGLSPFISMLKRPHFTHDPHNMGYRPSSASSKGHPLHTARSTWVIAIHQHVKKTPFYSWTAQHGLSSLNSKFKRPLLTHNSSHIAYRSCLACRRVHKYTQLTPHPI
ncbi:hypothetical protein RRG08_018395 [Elysia crispata]|uniref:Uncharacterized protein n=1 Tax=Elysia crispata TaxID=231223 RepID=A0AAE1ADM9_9GAST|nr:hypothetical protein RRG08_018395 [Elysia crispata]